MRYKSIHILAALFLIVGMGIQMFASYRQARRHVQKRLDLEMQLAQQKLVFELYDAYEAVEQLDRIVRDNLNHPENLQEVTREFISRYPNFYTCYVAFPENRYSTKGRWYCPSSYRVRDTIITDIFGDEQHDYFTREWYSGAIGSRDYGYWSQPYRDEDFDETIYTYSDDIRDEQGNLLAVVGLDFSLNWMHELLDRFKPFEEVVFELYSSNGTLLTSSDKRGGDDVKAFEKRKFDNRYWVVSRCTLQPVGLDMMVAVPQRYIWEGIRLSIVLPFCVFLLGILVVAFLLRRMLRASQDNLRLETEKEVMAHELQIAHGIQMGILRHDFPSNEHLQMHAELLPMREVGGDLYDFHCEGDRLWFIIGDVSGKGVPAAMFMSATVNLFRAAGRRLSSPKAIMEEMNYVLSDNNPSMTFVTAFVGRLNIKTGQLCYCNAGHCEPIIASGSKAVYLPVEPNIPLGFDGKYSFTEQGCMLGEGDLLVLYTDGVTEARNAARKMLGKQQWSQIVSQGGDLLSAVKRYIGHAEPTDDITLMTVGKLTAVEPLTLCVPNRDDQWPVLKQAIHEYGMCMGMDRRVLKKMEVAAEEAVVNIIRYSGATEINMLIEKVEQHNAEGSRMRLTFTDNGVPFDPTACESDPTKAVSERQIGGLGISLIRQIADEMHYSRTDNLNELIIIKNI